MACCDWQYAQYLSHSQYFSSLSHCTQTTGPGIRFLRFNQLSSPILEYRFRVGKLLSRDCYE